MLGDILGRYFDDFSLKHSFKVFGECPMPEMSWPNNFLQKRFSGYTTEKYLLDLNTVMLS